MAEEAAAEGDAESYYDEESGSDSDKSEPDEAAGEADQPMGEVPTDATTNAETATEDGGAANANNEEEEKKEDEDDEDEYDSDYDEEGRYIWGQEGEDWEFYYQEDKEAYERGESTVPEVMNPGALPTAGQTTVVTSTATGGQADMIIGVSMARDGAVYRTTKKKLKQPKNQAAAADSGAWKNY